MKIKKRSLALFSIPAFAAVALSALLFLNGNREIASPDLSGVTAPETFIQPEVADQAPARVSTTAPVAVSEPETQDEVAGETAPENGAGMAVIEEEDFYPGTRVTRERIRALHGDQPLTLDHPHMAKVNEVKKRYAGALMAHPSVVGVAVTLNEQGQIAIVVLTKADASDLPKVIEGIPVVFNQTGELLAGGVAAPPQGDVTPQGKPAGKGPKVSFDPTAKHRPAPIGVSTGHPNITAGTLGCLVTDGTDLYALSNNHVYADVNTATIGDDVLQPGAYDGGSAATDVIGTLYDYEPIDFTAGAVNTIDAAIALVDPADVSNATGPDGYGTPLSVTFAAALGDKVMKCGRTTGYTTGKVYAINATVNINYGGGLVAQFGGQVIIDPGTFSAGGDSGSLIVHAKSTKGKKEDPNVGKPVALLFAGSTLVTIANPIDLVLARFGVAVDGD